MRHGLHRAAVAALLSFTFGVVHAQTVFKCRDAKGQVSFQHQPCDGNGTGAIAVQPPNVVDGKPDGDRISRAALARRERIEAIHRRYEARNQVAAGSTLRPCYTELEIRNATMDASSSTKTREQRRAAERREIQMRSCLK